LLLGTDGGLFESIDDGKNWKRSDDELGNYRIYSMFKGESGSIYASTDHGFYELKPEITSVEEISLPSGYKLEQNYPNPFNPSTNITYTLPARASVTIKVYDMTGKEVAVLVNGSGEPGTHTVTWKGVDNTGNPVSSGIYLYRISADNFHSAKKMMLIK
jgi:hypothetical protein